VNEMHTKIPWIGVNGKSNKGICMRSWISFMDCIKLHKLTVFPADVAEKQSVTTCSINQEAPASHGASICVMHGGLE
jgi:hypothetical protein